MPNHTPPPTSIKNIIRFAGAFCAFCIGAGFASGQEVLQFFTSHGLYSFGALAISMVLFMWIGASLMSAGNTLQLTDTTKIFEYYCGIYIGKVLELIVPVFLFCVVVIMISGAGATLEQHYGLSPYTGRGLMAGASLLTVLLGLNRLISIIGFIGPAIIAFSLVAGIIGICNATLTLDTLEAQIASLEVAKADPAWYKSGILYAAFMIFGSAPFFAGVGVKASNRTEAILSGLLGGFALILAAGAISTGMLLNLPQLHDKSAPALALVGNDYPLLGTLFSIVLLMGIYTTAAPMLWTVCNRIIQEDKPAFRIVACVVAALALACGLLPFGQLIGTIYVYTGYIGIFFICCIVYKQFFGKKSRG